MSKKKNVFFVSLNEAGKEAEDILPDLSLRWPKRYLTIGDDPDCDIIVSIQGIPPRHRFLEKRGGKYAFIIPPGIEGTITIGDNTFSINGMVEFGLLRKRGDSCIFPIPAGKICMLKVRDITLTFGCKDIIIPEKKIVKLERSLKRPLIAREDYAFLFILIMSTIIHFSTVGYLNSIEIKKAEPLEVIKDIPHRFAKLILQPPKEKILKEPFVTQTPEEEKIVEPENEEEPREEIEKEEPEPLSEEEETVIPEIEEFPPQVMEESPELKEPLAPVTEEPVVVPPIDESSKAAAENKKTNKIEVSSKGLLGIIMAKAGPKEIPGETLFREVDDLLSNDIVKGDNKGKKGKEMLPFLKGLKDIKRKIAVTPPPDIEARHRTTSEIINEKKGVILEEIEGADKKMMSYVDEEIVSPKNEEVVSKRKRDETKVYKTIIAYVGGLKYLYNNALRKNPSLKGKVKVKLNISPDGKVVKAEIISSTLHAPVLEKAIINRVYRWRFPEIKDGEDFDISYTFDFAPVG